MSRSPAHKKALQIYRGVIGDSPTDDQKAMLTWMRTEASEAEAVTMAAVAAHVQREGTIGGLGTILSKAYGVADSRFQRWNMNRVHGQRGRRRGSHGIDEPTAHRPHDVPAL